MKNAHPNALLPVAAGLLALVCGACGPSDSVQPVAQTRALDAPRPESRFAADARARFFAPPAEGGGAHAHGAPGASGDAAPALAWDLPAGWKELPASAMRAANFAVPARERLECYVTLLPGGGGGLAANLNRWRGQMGLAPLSADEIAALPRIPLLGGDAAYVEMDGTFGGSDGFTMAGAALERAGEGVFVKMTGPAADVRAEVPAFKALCASLRARQAPAAHGEAPSGDEAPLAWTAPEGWTQGAAKPMRVVTFVPDGQPRVECYVSVLAGSGGGLDANVNRWRTQLGQPALDAAGLAALPTVEVLGRASPFAAIEAGEKGIYGVVCELGAQAVFVKMTGPAAALRAERERFLEFCGSLAVK